MSSISINAETGLPFAELESGKVEPPRLLMISFCCDPDFTMEDRNGWHRAISAAQDFRVTVLVSPMTSVSRLRESVPCHLRGRIEFVSVPVTNFELSCLYSEFLFYWGYRAWMKKGLDIAKELHQIAPFALSHMVSLCGYRVTGDFWKLQCPSIVGPLGGTSNFPFRYLAIAGFSGGVLEVIRNVINHYQLNYSTRIKRTLQSSSVVFAANMAARRDLLHSCGVSNVPVELETGLDYEPAPYKQPRDPQKPFKILWSGRLRAWKGLPLLLYAIAKLPKECPVELRVLGDGKCKKKWKNLADRLRIAHCIEWIERPHYRDSLSFYQWADMFAFTSLRDTSGSGLLEALAAGTPIVGMNHQGAADIMTDSCAVKVRVTSIQESVTDFANAILQLSTDQSELNRLSEGAILRASHYVWAKRYPSTLKTYNSLVQNEFPTTADSAT